MPTSPRAVRLNLLAILALVSAACAPEPVPAPPPDRAADEAAIRAMVATHESQVNARDFAGFAAAFADEGDLIAQNNPKATGPQAIQAAMEAGWANMPAEQKITLQVDRIRFVGNDGAIVDNTGTFSVGPATSDRATAVLERRDGQWKVVALRIYPGTM